MLKIEVHFLYLDVTDPTSTIYNVKNKQTNKQTMIINRKKHLINDFLTVAFYLRPEVCKETAGYDCCWSLTNPHCL